MRKTLLVTVTLFTLLLLISTSVASTERVILSFTGGPDGGSPQAPLLADAAGNLYGTASTGGANNSNCGAQGCGVVFMLTPPKTRTGTWTETVLYQFQGGNDLAIPMAGLIFDKAGNLYGSTVYGGPYGGGVFELSPPTVPGGAWTETVLYDFYQSDDDGVYPLGRLAFDTAGNLYGTCLEGGDANFRGTVFQLVPPPQPGQQWSENLLHVFGFYFNQGAYPQGTLLLDKHGNLYGTTMYLTDYYDDKAVFFELSPRNGGQWSYSLLYTFDGKIEGDEPADLTILAGRLYGTAAAGGAGNAGTVFSLTPPAPGSQWKETTIYTFKGGTDGGSPTRSLVADKSGNLYGATTKGGTNDNGTVFKLSRQGGTWTKTTLHKFSGGGDGSQPASGLIFGKFGALYGVTAVGGPSSNGTVYALLP